MPLIRPDLNHERYDAIIEFLLRNHLATNATLRKTIMPNVAVDTAQKLILRLIKRGFLKRCKLHSSQSYLRLGPQALKSWNYPALYSNRLAAQTLKYLYGCLAVATYSDPPKTRLLPEELELLFPGFPDNLINEWAYYLEPIEKVPTLFSIRVESQFGKAVIAKLSEQLFNYRKHETLAALIANGRFGFHVLATTPHQEKSIWVAAERNSFPVPLRTCHDRGLTRFS